MTDKPSCETCPHKEMHHSYGYDRDRPRCKITKWFLDACSPTGVEHDFINKVGCLSHPQAREYLVGGPVLKELERRADLFGGEYGVAYNAAIYLIRNGVEK